MRVAIVENMALTPLGLVGTALREAGARISMFRPYLDGGLPGDPATHDALVVLGGEQSALADATHPYLPALAGTMRDYAGAGRAVLGICLGSQILARGLGAANHLGIAREFGWRQVHLTGDGRRDPVLSAASESFPVFQWHSDTFALPAGAVHLAQNADVALQGFRAGRAAYGFQFHFEASREVVAGWTRDFPAATEAMSPGWTDRHPREADRHGAAADAAGLAIARAWVNLI